MDTMTGGTIIQKRTVIMLVGDGIFWDGSWNRPAEFHPLPVVRELLPAVQARHMGSR